MEHHTHICSYLCLGAGLPASAIYDFLDLFCGLQDFVFWGRTVMLTCVVVYLPLAIAASYTRNLHFLIAAEV